GPRRKSHVMPPSSWTQRVPDGPGQAWKIDVRPRTRTWAIVRTALGLMLPRGELLAGLPLADGRADGWPEGRAKANQTATRRRTVTPTIKVRLVRRPGRDSGCSTFH